MTMRWVEVGGPSILTEGRSLSPLLAASQNNLFVFRRWRSNPHDHREFRSRPSFSPEPHESRNKSPCRPHFGGGRSSIPPSPPETVHRLPRGFVSARSCARSVFFLVCESNLLIGFALLHSVPAQDSKTWREGGDAQRERLLQDPNMTHPVAKPAVPPPSAPAKIEERPKSTPVVTPTATVVSSIEKLAISDRKPVAAPTPPSVIAPASPAPVVSPNLSSTSAPFNPSWSRKFLTGKTPLNPDYQDMHGLSATMGADVQMLKVNSAPSSHPFPSYIFG